MTATAPAVRKDSPVSQTLSPPAFSWPGGNLCHASGENPNALAGAARNAASSYGRTLVFECVFAVPVLEPEPVDPRLPGLPPLRRDGELHLLRLAVDRAGRPARYARLSASRCLARAARARFSPPHLPRLGSLPPKPCFLLSSRTVIRAWTRSRDCTSAAIPEEALSLWVFLSNPGRSSAHFPVPPAEHDGVMEPW